jgi:hypothetical protein
LDFNLALSAGVETHMEVSQTSVVIPLMRMNANSLAQMMMELPVVVSIIETAFIKWTKLIK